MRRSTEMWFSSKKVAGIKLGTSFSKEKRDYDKNVIPLVFLVAGKGFEPMTFGL